MKRNLDISYLDVLLNIAESDPKMALVFVPSDISFAKDELAEMRHKLSERERELGNDMHAAISQANVEAYRILKAENEQLRETLGQTWCAYCEKIYPRTPDSMEQIREHIAVCEKHPMRKLETEIAELTSTLAIYADSTNWTLHMAAASSGIDPRPAEWDGPGYGPQFAKEALDTFVKAS